LQEWFAAYGGTPRDRAAVGNALAAGRLAREIRRRMEEGAGG